MLDFAAAQSGASRVTWRQADALRLPFNDGAFDIVPNTSPPSTRARARAREAAGNQRPWPADKVVACGEMIGGLFYENYPAGTGLVSGATRAVESHRQEPAAGSVGHLGERIRDSVHQPDADRLGDAVHGAEGASEGGAGAGRAATDEGPPGGVAAGALNKIKPQE